MSKYQEVLDGLLKCFVESYICYIFGAEIPQEIIDNIHQALTNRDILREREERLKREGK